MCTPPAFVDEAWNASRSWALLTTGQAFGTLDAGVFQSYNGYWTVFPQLGTIIHAVTIAIFGPNLFAMRVVSLLCGVLLLLAVYAIGNRLYGTRAGVLATLLTATSATFLYISHVGRHDIVVAAMGFGAVWLYLTESRRVTSRWGVPTRSLLAGLLIGLTLDVHPNGVIFGPVMLGLYLYDNKLAIWKSKQFWAFVAGGTIGVVFFAAMHLLKYPQTYFALLSLANGNLRTPPILSLDATVWQRSLVDTFRPLALPMILLTAISFAALGFGAQRRRSEADKKVLFIFVLLVLSFMAVIRGKAFFYAGLISPAAALLVAAFLERLFRVSWWESRVVLARNAAVWTLVALACLACLGGLLPAMRNDSNGEFEATNRRIAQIIPRGSRILGTQTFWFALPGEKYYSWEQIVYYRRYVPGSTLEQAMRYLHPDYLVLDEWVQGAVRDYSGVPAEKLPFLYIPKGDFDTLISERGRLVGNIETEAFGSVRIYKLDWNVGTSKGWNVGTLESERSNLSTSQRLREALP